jgi:hypothetical protein
MNSPEVEQIDSPAYSVHRVAGADEFAERLGQKGGLIRSVRVIVPHA